MAERPGRGFYKGITYTDFTEMGMSQAYDESFLFPRKFPQQSTFPSKKSFEEYQRLLSGTKSLNKDRKWLNALDIRSDVLYGKGGPSSYGNRITNQVFSYRAEDMIEKIKPSYSTTGATLADTMPRTAARMSRADISRQLPKYINAGELDSRLTSTLDSLKGNKYPRDYSGRRVLDFFGKGESYLQQKPREIVDYWSTRGASDVTEKGAGILSRLKGMIPGGGSAGALGKTYGDYYKDIPGGAASKGLGTSGKLAIAGIVAGLATMALTTSPKGREAIETATGVEGTEALSPFRRVTAQAMWGGIEEKPQVVGMQTYMAMTKGYNDIAAGGFKELRRQTAESTTFLQKYGQENEIMTQAMTQFNDSMIKSIDIGEAVNKREMERKRIIETTKPVRDQLNQSLDNENILMEANRRELKYKQQDLQQVEGTIGKLMGARFQTGAEIGGVQVSSQLGGEKHMWDLQKNMLEAQRAQLLAPDPYSQYNQMVGSERMAGGAGRVGVAQANLSFVTAASGTSAKDRAMVAVQQLRAEEQLRSAQAGLDIETEHQRAQAADITGQAYENASKAFNIAQLDMQLTYGNMEKQLQFFVAAHQDAANIKDGIPGSLGAIETMLKSTWASQTDLNDSIDGLKTSISGNDESIAAFKENLRDLKENGVDYLNASLREHNRLREDREGYSPLTDDAPDLVDAPTFNPSAEEIKTSGYLV